MYPSSLRDGMAPGSCRVVLAPHNTHTRLAHPSRLLRPLPQQGIGSSGVTRLVAFEALSSPPSVFAKLCLSVAGGRRRSMGSPTRMGLRLAFLSGGGRGRGDGRKHTYLVSEHKRRPAGEDLFACVENSPGGAPPVLRNCVRGLDGDRERHSSGTIVF